ncbi:MAG: 4Fe-4S binding protein [Spirochaetia bacterium]|nr:4Fe-4S binding protein [Spirochaetia bacterium]
MTKKQTGRNVFRIITEVLSLVLVVILLINGKLQIWFGIFAVGALVSVFAGRFYCGWICPMGTLFRPLGWVYKKLGIKRLKTPELFKKNWVRIGIFLLFIGMMVLTKVLKLKVDILPYMIAFSVILTLFFTEDMWHHHLCPFGSILSISSGFSKKGIRIDESVCIACGKCQKVCPSQSIIMLETKKRANKANECLVCYKCQDVCPVNTCNYGKLKG